MGVRYRQLSADDAGLLARGIGRVYGDTYPVPEFYDPQWLASAIESRLLHSIVALDESSEVVGCMSTVLEVPGDFTADGSALMIAPEFRGQGIVAELGQHSLVIYRQLGLSGLHLYALALHDLVQNQSGRAGAVVTGVLPAWFNRNARVAGYDYPDARIGAVALYMPLASGPARTCYLPADYEAILRKIYGELSLERFLKPCLEEGVLPAHTSSTLDLKPANRQLRLVVDRIGEDFPAVISRQLQRVSTDQYEVLYLDLPLSDAAVNRATVEARDRGFFFGALMIERRGGDRLRLQFYGPASAAAGHMVLASPQAEELLAFVMADQDRAQT